MVQNFVKISQENKHIIVKNAGGLRGLTGETGPRGPQGEPGQNGIDGHSATVAIGETTTLPAGSNASVVNTGTTYDAVFNFGIPKGEKGDKGDAGAGLMITGSVETYADLPDDLTEADAGKAYFVQADGKLYVWSGTQFPADGEGSQFEGPSGPRGEQGPQGEPGEPAPLPEGAKTVVDSTIAITDAGTEGITELKIDGNTTQTTYTGKNLFNVDGEVVAQNSSTYSISGGAITVTQSNANLHNALIGIKIPNSENLLGKTINISLNAKSYSGATGGRVILWDNTTTTAYLTINNPDAQGNMSGSLTLPNSFPGASTFFVLYFYTNKANAGGSAGGYTVFTNVQIEVGSAKTSYEPYVGGVASPSPDYPQNVNVVSGTQTITITDGGSQSQTKTVRLGSLELCKVGTYQDYIYKSGDDWYVHKETDKVVFTGAETETWSSETAATGYVRFNISSGATHADNNGYCNELTNRGSQSHGAYEYVWVQPDTNAFHIQLLNTRVNDLASFRTWLGANPATVYYALETATDTKITDADLVSDLDGLLGATLYLGTNDITVSGSPIPAILDLTYFTWYRGPEGATGATGATGPAGADGYSPTATVTQTQTGATITITDKDGTTTANIYNGTSGTTDYADLTDVYYTDKTLTAVWDSVNGQYNITTTSPIRTTAPVVGDKIRVQFDTTHTGSQVKIKVNSDSVLNCVAYPIYSASTSVASALQIVNTNRVYEFVKTQETGQSAVWSCLDSHSQVGASDIADNAITGTANVGFGGNLALDTVGTANLVDAAVSTSKIDWTTISTSGKFEFGDYLVQYGFETVPQDTTNTWRDATFPTPFGSQPTLIGCINTAAGYETNASITPRISVASTTGFRWACTTSTGYTANQRLSWIAIGTKASNNSKGPSEPVENDRGISEEPSPETPADENQR